MLSLKTFFANYSETELKTFISKSSIVFLTVIALCVVALYIAIPPLAAYTDRSGILAPMVAFLIIPLLALQFLNLLLISWLKSVFAAIVLAFLSIIAGMVAGFALSYIYMGYLALLAIIPYIFYIALVAGATFVLRGRKHDDR